MHVVVEEAKANDPKALRVEIARLRRELAEAQASQAGRVVEKPVEVIPEAITQLTAVAAESVENVRQHVIGLATTIKSLAKVRLPVVRGRPIQVNGKTVRPYQVAGAGVVDVDARINELARAGRTTPAGPSFGGAWGAEGAGDLGAAAPGRALRALASRHPEPCSKRQVATLATIPVKSSTFRNAVSLLNTRGFIERLPDDMLKLTPAGLDAAGGPGTPKTAAELLAMWRAQLTGKAKDLLDLFAAEPETWTKAEVAKRIGIDPTTSTFRNYMSELRTNDLIRKTSGGFIINPELAL
jgi:uncharacterized protein